MQIQIFSRNKFELFTFNESIIESILVSEALFVMDV